MVKTAQPYLLQKLYGGIEFQDTQTRIQRIKNILMNPETHIIMDWLKCLKYCSFLDAPIPYHATNKVGEIVDEYIGTKTDIFECLTCKGIVAKGDVLDYRVSKGQANRWNGERKLPSSRFRC